MKKDIEDFFKYLKKTAKTCNFYTLALLKKHQYWDKFLSLIFNYSSRCYQRKGPLQIQKFKNPVKELKYFSDNFGRFSPKTLIGKVSKNEEDIQIVKNLLTCAFRKIKQPKIYDYASSEILSKVMAYRNLEEGMSFDLGYINDEGELALTTYTVSKIFDLWHKHIAFGLTPNNKEAAPILLFRGTNFSMLSEGGRASIISDLDPEGPGKRLFHNSKSVLRQWLQKMAHQEKKTRVLGYSLGGALATYTALYEYDLINLDENHSSFSFNPPGINQELLNDWHAIEMSEKPQIKTFVTRGDIISKFGALVGDVYEVSTDRLLSPVIAHERLVFSEPVCYLIKVDIDKENDSESRKYYSKLQKQTTSLTYRFGLKYLFPNNPLDI